LTYGALDQWSDDVALELRARGVGPGTLVGICMERGIELAVALLAVVKSGGAYLPLDPDEPPDRSRLLLGDAQAALMLTAGAAPAAAWPLPVLRVEETVGLRTPRSAPSDTARPDDLLYVLYTSGSTGRPKAIAMEHGPTVELLTWCERSYRGRPTMLHYFPITSDVGSYEILTAWWTGGCVVVADERDRFDIARIAGLIERHHITTILLPFVALDQLARYFAEQSAELGSLAEIVTTGDRLTITPAIRAMCGKLDIKLLDNQWGSTEVNVVTTLRLRQPAADWAELPSVGNPVANAQIHVLDENFAQCPVRVPGEIYVGGSPLSRGYLGRPELTAAAFLPDPFATTPGARMYRTGDIGRWQWNGELEFLGRADFQVKIHGFRVEPGEVEAALRGLPDVVEAAVVAADAGTPRARLVAYLVTTGRPPTESDLRARLRDALPQHMFPEQFVQLDRLPRTTTGKIDRRALPTPDPRPRAHQIAPRTEFERIVAEIWEDILNTRGISVEDNFFDLGGHSLLITQVIFRIKQATGSDLPVRMLFSSPTVAALAAELGRMAAHAPADRLARQERHDGHQLR
jgi:amino acid adenylation domain-containing protein